MNLAFQVTEQNLIGVNKSTNVIDWTSDTVSAAAHKTIPQMDEISFQAIGAISEPNIDWQNRPTFQQVVSFN